MAKTQDFKIEIDGNNYDISVRNNIWTGKTFLTINDEEEILKNKGQLAFLGIVDSPIYVGEKELRLVAIGKSVDIAMDGTFLGSKQEYKPAWKLPWWGWVFVAICLAMPILSLGGALPFFIGFVGAGFCAKASIKPQSSIVKRVFSCLAIAAFSWIIFYAIVIALSSVTNSF